MVSSIYFYINRKLGIKIFNHFCCRFEKFKLKPPAQTCLVNLHQKGIHFIFIGQLFQQRPKRFINFFKLLAIQVKIDCLTLLT